MKPFAANNIQGGELVEALDDALARIAEDAITRPLVRGARKVTLTVTLAPDLDPTADRNSPVMQWGVAVALPGIKSAAQRTHVSRKTNRLMVSDDGGDADARQTELPMGDERGE